MIIKDSGSTQDFPPTPQGLHPAVCYGLVDIGHHTESYMGEPKDRHVLFILFELPTLTIEIEGVNKPRGISQKYTKSLGAKANLRRDLESWRGRKFDQKELEEDGFDLNKILGGNCQLNIVHNVVGDKTYANISSIVPHGMMKYENFNEIVCYDISEGANVPPMIPDWLKEKIYQSFEFNMQGQQKDEWGDNEPRQEPDYEPDDSDDVPF